MTFTSKMTEAQKRAFDEGLRDGKRSWSGTNPYTFSVLMDFYAKGFEAGSRELHAAA
jgi:hypothetical protein